MTEAIIRMILLGKDHTAAMFRNCGIKELDEQLVQLYNDGYFEDIECHELTVKGKEFLEPYLNELKDTALGVIRKKEFNTPYSLESLTEDMGLEDFSQGYELTKYLFKFLPVQEEKFRLEVGDKSVKKYVKPDYII